MYFKSLSHLLKMWRDCLCPQVVSAVTAWLLTLAWLPNKGPVAPCCCRSDRQTALCSGHQYLGPSGSLWQGRTETCQRIRSRVHWPTDWATIWLTVLVFCRDFKKAKKKKWTFNASLNIKSGFLWEHTLSVLSTPAVNPSLLVCWLYVKTQEHLKSSTSFSN